MPLKLIIGNKTYSSWSMRPWLLMRTFGIAFDEIVIPLRTAQTGAVIAQYSPAGKVPILIDGDLTVWDSLAIIDHLADDHPELGIWPHERTARATARSLAAEMHSGFSPLRRALPMNMQRAPKPPDLDAATAAEVAANVARIEAAWADARARFGSGGAFLFGPFCAADAMFAPVVNRFEAYAVPVNDASRDYMAAVRALPSWQDWHAGAQAEGWRVEAIDAL